MNTGRPSPLTPTGGAPDLVCLSHLRWSFVFQRPQHLLRRAARDRRVFYVEEPVWDGGSSRLETRTSAEGVCVVTPHLADGTMDAEAEAVQRALLDRLWEEQAVRDFVLWYYTPMALAFTRHLRARATVYDVMDELSLFRFAPPALLEREAELLRRSDLVFTGGRSLFEVKQPRHPNVRLFPSSVDVGHFASARDRQDDPSDQADIPHPRLGFFGVIDERMDLGLLERVASIRPDWHIVLVGPVAKIDPEALPRAANLHYLGAKEYAELPRYAAGWDVALMPWALNEATRFISPTKTPEYLAAGRPVVSTPVADVVRPYGEAGLVRIAAAPEGFVREVEAALAEDAGARAAWQARVDAVLSRTSWDRTWEGMRHDLAAVLADDRADAAAQAEPTRDPIAAD